jgi:CO dehydrogenase maturation factor
MKETEGGKTSIIAVCGKGGVGKTSISAITSAMLAEDPANRVLAIDADPAVGLALALGFRARRTVDDIRNDLIAKVKEGVRGDMGQMAKALDYEVLAALEEKNNLAFLAIGRPEQEGCYCQVNDFLKDVIETVSASFDYVVIDGEAGIEQVNRRVMERVSHLLLVSDQSAKGLAVASSILDVAGRAVGFDRCGLVINRVRAGEDRGIGAPPGLHLLGSLPEDDNVRTFDMEGKCFLDLPECPVRAGMRRCLSAFGLYPAAKKRNTEGVRA